MKPIRIALSKGRVASAAKDKLLSCGYRFPNSDERLLFIIDESQCLELLLLKAQDVPIYVEKGVADLGIVGADVLREQAFDVFMLKQLDFGHCRMCLCGSAELDLKALDYVRLASKYPQVAEDFLAQKGLPGEVTYLSGSVELAPLLGVSDFIVDIVESGKTLAAHQLVIHETLFDISSVLIANKIRYKLYFEAIQPILAALSKQKEVL